jgi:hypothetical protein
VESLAAAADSDARSSDGGTHTPLAGRAV